MRGITENAVRDIFEHIKNKGTIVDKPQEEIVENGEHLRHLIGIVKTIESSLRKSSGSVRAFGASLNLVDLAGSERASQTNADGERLKKGSHINCSLLTLTTVTGSEAVEKEVVTYHIGIQNLLDYCSLHLGEMLGQPLYAPLAQP
ncbi:kinesin-like protein KIN-7B [Pyrus x bretschneideri]|uniref:kinesin-like protein KIN-7B n=1 Tax=Pyrus x bretschneideri TaxID=225117 RepID=UPI00202DC64E|nr:kinesin-like protein KIN-7B [Pyrus x bretschneideri]